MPEPDFEAASATQLDRVMALTHIRTGVITAIGFGCCPLFQVWSDMVELTENQVRHLEAIQHVITRLAGNSFALKALAGTIAAAVIAYAGATDNSSPWVSGAGILPSVVFWLMVAQYLRLERLFRKLYDGVRHGEVTEPFDMNFIRYSSEVESMWCIAKSWSVLWFYLILVVVLIGVAVVG